MRVHITGIAPATILGSMSPMTLGSDLFVAGAVDFGGPGNFGSPLTVDGTLSSGFISPWLGDPTVSGVAISSSSAAPSNGLPAETPGAPGFGPSSYTGAYFIAGGVPAGTTPDGRVGVFIMNLAGEFTSINAPNVNILVGEDTDGDGAFDVTENLNFSGLGTAGQALDGTYDLDFGGFPLGIEPFAGVAGNTELWLVTIPAPGTAAPAVAAGGALLLRRRRAPH